MAGDPAIRKVLTALADLLATIPQITVHIDKLPGDRLVEEERPAICIRVVEQAFEPWQGVESATLHSVSLDLDIYEESPVFESITARHSEIIAMIVERVHASRANGGTLAAMLFRIEEAGATADENSVPDLGCATFTYELQFLTPRGDFRTIIGEGGTF